MSREINKSIRRNSIIWVDLGANKGHIQSGCRPCIVVSCDIANRKAPIFTVIPGTTQHLKKDYPVHITINPSEVDGFIKKNTVFLAEQICTIDINQVISVAGNVICKEKIDEVNRIILRQLELEG